MLATGEGSEVSAHSEATEGSVELSAVVFWVDLDLGSLEALALDYRVLGLDPGWDDGGVDLVHDIAEPWPLWAWGLV